MVATEQIPDGDKTSREIFYPQMTRDEREAVFCHLFDFSGGQPESVIWRRYCTTDKEVHELGLAHESAKRLKNPSIVYVGFGTASAGDIRSISNRIKDGHGFDVRHEPSEGIQHAEVFYHLRGDGRYETLTKNQRQELRFVLSKLFEPVTTRP